MSAFAKGLRSLLALLLSFSISYGAELPISGRLEPTLNEEKVQFLEMMELSHHLGGSKLPSLREVQKKGEALVEKLGKDPAGKKEALLIEERILKPLQGLVKVGSVLEACGKGEKAIFSGLERQFINAMLTHLPSPFLCQDLEAIPISPTIEALSRNVVAVGEALETETPSLAKKIDDQQLFERIKEKARELAIIGYFKEYSKLKGELPFDSTKLTTEANDLYFELTGRRLSLSPQEEKIGYALSRVREIRSEEFKRSQKSTYEEFVKGNQESYRKELEQAFSALSQAKKNLNAAEETVRGLKQMHNVRYIYPPQATEREDYGLETFRGPRLVRRGIYGGLWGERAEVPEGETAAFDAYDGVASLSANPIDVDVLRGGAFLLPRRSADAKLEKAEIDIVAYMEKGKKVSTDYSRARDLGYYKVPPPAHPDANVKSFFERALGPGTFDQFNSYLDRQLDPIRERATAPRISLESAQFSQLIQTALGQVMVTDTEGRKRPALENAVESVARARAQYEILKASLYRDFVVVRQEPKLMSLWKNDQAGAVDQRSITEGWKNYDSAMKTFLKETLPKIEKKAEKDPKKEIKLALKEFPSAVLGVLLDAPQVELAKHICKLGNEIEVDEIEAEEARLTWGVGATLAVGGAAVLTYGLGPLFGYALGFGIYGDALFSGAATAIGAGHMLFSSVPEYRELAFEAEVMEESLLALGEGDPQSVRDKMGEVNARFVELVGEGVLNAAGALQFIKSAAALPAAMRMQAIKRELEALKRAREGVKGLAKENVQRGLGRDFDQPITGFGEKRVYELSDAERIQYAEKALNLDHGVIKNDPFWRDALLKAHAFDEAELAAELLRRGESLNSFSPEEIRSMVIAGKARRLAGQLSEGEPQIPDPFREAGRRELFDRGIAGNEAFIRGGTKPVVSEGTKVEVTLVTGRKVEVSEGPVELIIGGDKHEGLVKIVDGKAEIQFKDQFLGFVPLPKRTLETQLTGIRMRPSTPPQGGTKPAVSEGVEELENALALGDPSPQVNKTYKVTLSDETEFEGTLIRHQKGPDEALIFKKPDGEIVATDSIEIAELKEMERIPTPQPSLFPPPSSSPSGIAGRGFATGLIKENVTALRTEMTNLMGQARYAETATQFVSFDANGKVLGMARYATDLRSSRPAMIMKVEIQNSNSKVLKAKSIEGNLSSKVMNDVKDSFEAYNKTLE